jgi:hypothetical protein
MKSQPPNYTKGSAQSMVAVIECVYSMENIREVEDVLEQLRQYGAAQVVEKFPIKESFDDACKILDKRAKGPK